VNSDEFVQHVEVMNAAQRGPLTFIMGRWQFAAICTALGYKVWIESKGKRGHKPNRKWLTGDTNG
jgi:hypothetical protein